MGTYNNNCEGCGCGPSIPEPCVTPPPVCPDPQPCTEVTDAQCTLYTGPDIMCGTTIVVATNTNIAEALQAIVAHFCPQ